MTGMPLAFKMAWRYLSAPKTHGAVNAISIVSVVGVAVATAAIIIVLSVFNGFRSNLNARLDTLTSDVSITPAYGKTISNADSLAQILSELTEVETAMPAITDNALVIANSKEMPITLRGVNPLLYSQITSIDSLLVEGEPISGYEGSDASLSVGVAQRLGIYNPEDVSMLIFAPRRTGRVNPANPASSFLTDSLTVKSVFRSFQNEFDENTIVCDISLARKLFQYDAEATSIEIKGAPGVSSTSLKSAIELTTGEDYVVKDRLEQQEVNFRMISIEKWITFLLLAFILMIASFNIISTVCMFIVEKESSIHTLSNLGMNKKRIGRIFWWESIFVTMTGAAFGIVAGVGLSLLQEKFGLIKLAGDPSALIMRAYPVMVEWVDIAITCIPIVIIGLITAFIARGFAISQAKISR